MTINRLDPRRFIPFFALILLSVTLLSGCGGSGNSSSGSSGGTVTAAMDTVNGNLVDVNNNGVGGYSVLLNGKIVSTTSTASTGVTGEFTFTLLASLLAMSPTMTIEDTSGNIVESITLTPSKANTSGIINLPTFSLGEIGGGGTSTNVTVNGILINSSTEAGIAGYSVWVLGKSYATTTTSGSFTFGLTSTTIATSPAFNIENSAGTIVYSGTLTTSMVNSNNVLTVPTISITLTSSQSSYTVTGTVVNSSTGAGLSGYTLWVSGVTQSVATTSSSGGFTFTITSAILSASPTLTVQNTSGSNVAYQTLTVANAVGSTISLGDIGVSISTGVTTDTVTGTLTNVSTGAGIAGYTVYLGSVSEGTTSATGAFSFSISSTSLATSPTMTIQNPSQTVVYTTTLLTSQVNGSGNLSLGAIMITVSSGASGNITVTGTVIDFFTGNPSVNLSVLLNGAAVATTNSLGVFTFPISSATLATSPLFSVAGAESGSNGARTLTSSEEVDATINLGEVDIILQGEGSAPSSSLTFAHF